MLYAPSPAAREKVDVWLQVRKLHSPRDITYRNALEYIDWRTAYKKKSGRTVGRNTAIFELKTLSTIILTISGK